MTTYVFPGQGSQRIGMGETLFAEFEELTALASSILGYSIKELCMKDSSSNLAKTQYTQPALYVINVLSYLSKINQVGKKPDYVAGHSLGEYCALFAAGAFDFETGLKLTKKRGELMAQVTGGGMAAIIGLNENMIKTVLIKNNLENIDIANYNSATQVVISGLKSDIERAKIVFEKNKSVEMFIPLKVSGAFHSRYMESVQKKFEKFLDKFNFEQLTIPVISNVSGRPYEQAEINKNLVNQVTHSVRWSETIQYLIEIGENEFEEIGPGNVLTGLVRRIKKETSNMNKSKPKIIQREDIFKKVDKKNEVKATSVLDSKINEKVKQAKTEALLPFNLGNAEFKKDYNLKYAYLTGGMYRGISSQELVVKMGKAGMMGFFGSGGLEIAQIKDAIKLIQKELNQDESYGVNLLYNPNKPEKEEELIDLCLSYGVKNIEASAFLSVTPSLIKYRAKGLMYNQNGQIIDLNRIIAKVSRPEVAEEFLCPPSEKIIGKLLAADKITQEEANLLAKLPVANDICVEADSGGHTDGGVAYALMPAMIKLRNEIMGKYKYNKKIRVGAAGGIGTPEAAIAAFMLGADYIMTGSINQCTVEAATSDLVKDLLQQMNVQDTQYAPAGDMFEFGAKVQVLKKGLFFPTRANRLYELYRQFDSLNDIDEKARNQLQQTYFKKSFEDIYEEIKSYYTDEEIEKAERVPKYKMALVFKWYFYQSTTLALNGNDNAVVDYQIHCGPALGAFNQWVKGTELENWRNRHVDEIAIKLMRETAKLLYYRSNNFLKACSS